MRVSLRGILGAHADTIKRGVVSPPGGALLSKFSMVVKVAERGDELNDRAVGGAKQDHNEIICRTGPRGGGALRPEQGGRTND